MKILKTYIRILFLIIILFVIQRLDGQTIHTSGSLIIGPCGDTLNLRGVNYSPYNWGYSPDDLLIDEIAKSSANCVRIVWFEDAQGAAPNEVYQNPLKLREVLEACVANGLIPIIELHDQTCQNDGDALIALADWYLQDWVLELIEEFGHSLIINLFNESLHINWTGDVESGELAFIETYTEVIKKIREGGIQVPLMIDGSECGTNIVSLSKVAIELNKEDDNLIFSAHSYWQDYADSQEEMRVLIENAAATDLPFVIGELANFQDDQVLCEYALDFEYLMELCDEHNLGWMAWGWDRDNCGLRQVTEDGSFDNLTAFGDRIVNHPLYGLSTNPPGKSAFLTSDGGCISQVSKLNFSSEITIFPNPVQDKIGIRFGEGQFLSNDIQIYNAAGVLVLNHENDKELEVNVIALVNGVYFLKIGEEVQRFVKVGEGN